MFWTFIVLGIVMWLLQGLLNIYQLKKFNKELKNLRQSGRVAIGKARGRFKAGCLLLLCIDDDCKIITGKKLQGVTSFARFKNFNEIFIIKTSASFTDDTITKGRSDVF